MASVEWETFRLGTTVIEDVLPEAKDTGLIDQHGHKIYKTYGREPIGFIHFSEE